MTHQDIISTTEVVRSVILSCDDQTAFILTDTGLTITNTTSKENLSQITMDIEMFIVLPDNKTLVIKLNTDNTTVILQTVDISDLTSPIVYDFAAFAKDPWGSC